MTTSNFQEDGGGKVGLGKVPEVQNENVSHPLLVYTLPQIIFDIIFHLLQVREHLAEDIQRLSLHEGTSMLLVILTIIIIIILIIIMPINHPHQHDIAGLWRLPGIPPGPTSAARDELKV